MNPLNPQIAFASHVSFEDGELIFEQMGHDGGFITTTVIRPNLERAATFPSIGNWKHDLYAITGLRPLPIDPDGRAKLDHGYIASETQLLAAGSEIVIHCPSYTLAANVKGPQGLKTRFIWSSGSNKLSLDHFRPKPLGPDAVAYVIWLLTVAFHPFTVETVHETEDRFTITVA